MHTILDSYEIKLATFAENPKELTALMDTNSIDVLCVLAQNPRTYKKHLKVLAQHRDSEVRASVASNESTAPAVLAELAKDTDSDVRFYVALNTRTPQPALNILLTDADGEVARMARINMEAQDNEGPRLAAQGYRARFVSNALAVSLGLVSLMDDAGTQDA